MACCRALPEALVSPLADNAIIKTIPLEHFPRDLFMIGRSIMILRGLTHALGMDVQVTHTVGAMPGPLDVCSRHMPREHATLSITCTVFKVTHGM